MYKDMTESTRSSCQETIMEKENRKRLFRWGSLSFLVSGVLVFALASGGSAQISAQQLQIPTLQVCNKSLAYGEAIAFNSKRQGIGLPGTLAIRLKLECDPVSGDGYPYGLIELQNIRLNDSDVVPYLASSTIEQVSTVGRATPIIFIRGQCKAETQGEPIEGCRYWLMITDSKKLNERGTPDIVSLVVFDKQGNRRIYFTGVVRKGDLHVDPGV